MNKYKIIMINILLVVSLFLIVDISIYYRRLYMSSQYHPPFTEISYFQRIFCPLNKQASMDIIFKEKKYRPIENINSTKKPITLFGDSFVQGHILQNNQTFSYKLGKYTNRPIYNRAEGGWAVQHMLLQLESNEFYKIVPESEYVIYTYIPDHINRIHIANESIIFGVTPTFIYSAENLKYNELKYDNLAAFVFHFPILSFIKQGLYYKYKDADKKANNLKQHFKTAKNILLEKWPNSKFIIFIYEYDYEILSIIDELRNDGIIIVSFENLTNKNPQDYQYTISNYDIHPNEKAWDLIVPKLMNFINNIENINYPTNFIKYEKSKLEYYEQSKNEALKLNIKEIIKQKEYCSTFSICYHDRELIYKKEIKPIQANLSYIVYCIGNFTKNCHIPFIPNILKKLAYKINPNNELYSYSIKY